MAGGKHVSDDFDVNLNSRWAKLRAKIPSHGASTLVIAYTGLAAVVLGGIVGFTAILLHYELQFVSGGNIYIIKPAAVPVLGDSDVSSRKKIPTDPRIVQFEW